MQEAIIYTGATGKIRNMEDFKNLFRVLKGGRKYLVSVKNVSKRSLRQNAYYWGVVVPMVRNGLYDAGFDDVLDNDDAHEVIKSTFLKKRKVSKKTGEMIEVVGSTADLTIPEFNDLIERVCRWAAEYLGVAIPSPNSEFAEFEKYIQEAVA